jgi:Na+-translocating ferredoxin:NAD+ oxidoreductase RnfG subunit
MKRLLSAVVIFFMAAALMASYDSMRDSVVKELLPDTDMKAQVFNVDAALTEKVQKALGNKQPVSAKYEIYTSKSGGVVIEHQMGKWGMISMAISFDNDGKVSNIGIITMSEKRGAGIKEHYFIKQFIGKSISDTIELGNGITGLSGATISSRAVVIAVKRALIIYDAFTAQSKPLRLRLRKRERAGQ